MSNLIVPRAYTETDAVNYCLRAIGEAPIANAATATQADVIEILGHLQTVTAEVLARRWKFNTEIGYHLLPIGQLNWVSPITDNIEVLNVFAPPLGETSGQTMVSFRVTPAYNQSGPDNVDPAVRQAQTYTPDGGTTFPIIFYDRIKNREGWLASAYPYLKLDAVWFMDFVNLPYEAQSYVVTQAARRTVEQSVNSSEIANFVKTDEAQAYRNLTRRWQLDDDFNALRTVNAFRAYGNRPATNVGFIDIRGYQQPVNQTVITEQPATVSPASTTFSGPAGVYTQVFAVTNPNSAALLVTFGHTILSPVTAAVPQYATALVPASSTLNVTLTFTITGSSGSGVATLTATSTAAQVENTGSVVVTAT
jgi:hypothetical protein